MNNCAMVSTIITTYKRPPEILLRAINCVLNQTYKNIELIIVDDSPADYPQREDVKNAVLSLGDARIKYIAHEKNSGACVARNTGLKEANGEYVAFLDDDDEWLETKLEQQVKVIENCSDDTALVYCDALSIYDSTGETKSRNREMHNGHVYDKLILHNFIGSTSYPLMKTEALRSIGGFDPLMKAAQDMDVWLRLSKKYRVDYVNIPLVRYHVHEGECITFNPKNRIAGLERINEKNIDYLKANRYAYWRRFMAITRFYAADKQLGKALRVWFKTIWKQPFRIKDNVTFLYSIYCNWTEK